MPMEAFLLLLQGSVDRVLSLNVNAADGALKNAYLRAVAAGLDNAGLFLDTYDLADDTADRGNLVTNLKVVTHNCDFLFLLSLTATGEEEYCNNCYEHYNGHKQTTKSTATVVASCRARCEQKSCIEHNMITLS